MSLGDGLKIEEGRYYRRRDGIVVGPARQSGGVLLPWFVGADHCYTPHGSYSVNGEQSPLDLVAEAPAPSSGIGDITSDAKGTGARFNDGKMRVDLIPLWIMSAYEDQQFEGEITPELDEALAVLRELGQWQARNCTAAEVLERMDDPWVACAAVFDYGSRKYAAWNWAKGMPWSVPAACAARHLLAILRGEMTDPESGLPHIGHVACNLVMLAHFEVHYLEGDDRPQGWQTKPSA